VCVAAACVCSFQSRIARPKRAALFAYIDGCAALDAAAVLQSGSCRLELILALCLHEPNPHSYRRCAWCFLYCCYVHTTCLSAASLFSVLLVLCLSSVLRPLVVTGWVSSCFQITPVALRVIATCTDATHTDTSHPLCHSSCSH
jgi:hypothetical protein